MKDDESSDSAGMGLGYGVIRNIIEANIASFGFTMWEVSIRGLR